MKNVGSFDLTQPQRLARILVLMVGVVVVANTRTCHAFISHPNNNKNNNNMMRSSVSKTLLQQSQKSIIVVSPPGGVGEVTAVKAASMGASVKWFVVTSKYAKQQQQQSSETASATTTGISQDSLREIAKAGGIVQFAGADADALLTNERNALAAVATWCSSSSTSGGDGTAQGLVCCMDGADNVVDDVENTKENFAAKWKDAIKLAAKEASKGVTGCKLAILSEADDDDGDDDQDEKDGLGGGILGGLFGSKDATAVPNSLSSAIKATAKLRHGALFGIPESSVRLVCLHHTQLVDAFSHLLIAIFTSSYTAILLDSAGRSTKESNSLRRVPNAKRSNGSFHGSEEGYSIMSSRRRRGGCLDDHRQGRRTQGCVHHITSRDG
jgi:hypothetical protein